MHNSSPKCASGIFYARIPLADNANINSREVNNLKPKYHIFQNVIWMIKNAWEIRKSVLSLCILSSALAVGLNLTQLFIAPEILAKVELSAPLSELITTIIGFAALLFLLMGLRAYVSANTMWGRIEVRTALTLQIQHKSFTTSYPNLLRSENIKARTKAEQAVFANRSAGEHIWETLSELLTNIVGFCIYVTFLSNLNLFLLLVTLLTSITGFFFTKRANDWNYAHREEESSYLTALQYICDKAESITLAKDIRIFGLAGWLTDIQDRISDCYEAFLVKREGKLFAAGCIDVLLTFLRNGAAYFYLITLALQENLTASEFLFYFTAVSNFTVWITGILNQYSTLYKESLDLSALREYLDIEEPFRFESGAPIPPSDTYEFRLEHVSYRYPEAETDIIHDLNLLIRPGEKLAIVGLNGAGKTTLVKLLCGFLDPTEGCVLLNGRDIRNFNRRDYYALFSAVFQGSSILDATVSENVAQSVTKIDQIRVKDCLEKSGLTEVVTSLPKGMDSHIGREIYEDGVLLSGGQMQRLMLARALYKDGPVLILDEPTAALDPIAENDIYMKYNEMTAGKTSLFISHRLASTRFCDRILFLADGRIAEEGTHEQLLALNGGYAGLFEIQSRYYQEGRQF